MIPIISTCNDGKMGKIMEDKIVQVSGFGVENNICTQCNYILVALTQDGRVLVSRGDGVWCDVTNKTGGE